MSASIEDAVYRAVQSDIRMACTKAIEEVQPYCESPIEALFGATMILTMRLFYPTAFRWCLQADEDNSYGFLLMPQYVWKNYRIDWVLRGRVSDNDNTVYLFVECDGHDFHERTKEQAEHDRSKDRAIQASGIPIMRFTGRELYRDAGACVDQVVVLALHRLAGRI